MCDRFPCINRSIIPAPTDPIHSRLHLVIINLTVLKGSGYAPAVNGDDTLSYSSPSFSEMNITHVMKCQRQCGPELEQSTATPTCTTVLSSAFAMFTSAKKCQSEGGTEVERDSKGMPTTTDPQSSDSERNISLANTCQSQGGGCSSPAEFLPSVPSGPTVMSVVFPTTGSTVRTDPPRGSKEHRMLHGKSHPTIFHRADRQPQVMRR
jgi:hypothetical protein